jgi:hypothetical protein
MKNIILAIGVAGALAACVDDRANLENDGSPAMVGGWAIENAYLSGDFGARTGFDGEATQTQARSDASLQTSTLRVLRSEPDRGTAMVIIWTDGRTIESLEPGVYESFDDPEEPGDGTVQVNVCSGPDSYSIDYDRAADHVVTTVSDTAEGRMFEIYTETRLVSPSTGEVTGVEVSETNFTIGAAE